MWMTLPGSRKDQVSWQSLQCMLWAGSANPGMCGEGNTWVCSSWSNPGYSPCSAGERGAGNQVLGPSLMMGIYFPLPQTRVVSNVQKGRQCYVWEGQHFQSRIWCNGITQSCSCLATPKPPHSSCTAVSTLLFIHMVCPGLYLSSRDWEMPKLSPVKSSHCCE